MTNDQFVEWQRHNVTRQKQDGYVAATITLPLGDLTSEQLRVVAELALAYGDGTARLTIDQDLILRWIRVGIARSTRGWRRPVCSGPRPARRPTSRAVRAPSRASSP